LTPARVSSADFTQPRGRAQDDAGPQRERLGRLAAPRPALRPGALRRAQVQPRRHSVGHPRLRIGLTILPRTSGAGYQEASRDALHTGQASSPRALRAPSGCGRSSPAPSAPSRPRGRAAASPAARVHAPSGSRAGNSKAVVVVAVHEGHEGGRFPQSSVRAKNPQRRITIGKLWENRPVRALRALSRCSRLKTGSSNAAPIPGRSIPIALRTAGVGFPQSRTGGIVGSAPALGNHFHQNGPKPPPRITSNAGLGADPGGRPTVLAAAAASRLGAPRDPGPEQHRRQAPRRPRRRRRAGRQDAYAPVPRPRVGGSSPR
jgi:hypothetical protein